MTCKSERKNAGDEVVRWLRAGFLHSSFKVVNECKIIQKVIGSAQGHLAKNLSQLCLLCGFFPVAWAFLL
ncbi:MAG: hypothetical protein LH647_21420, partial [Leptolyngbyaceae cyanobacterium CAN_BIN12]|nr:hypothetical protein [Leptolyngbyaceae cyanobacterium CAN_BIN12]